MCPEALTLSSSFDEQCEGVGEKGWLKWKYSDLLKKNRMYIN